MKEIAKKFIVLFFLLLPAHTAFCIGVPQLAPPYYVQYINWIQPAALGVAISMAVVAIIFALSYGLHLEPLLDWTKAEFWQVIGILIVVVFVAAFEQFIIAALGALGCQVAGINSLPDLAVPFLQKTWCFASHALILATEGYATVQAPMLRYRRVETPIVKRLLWVRLDVLRDYSAALVASIYEYVLFGVGGVLTLYMFQVFLISALKYIAMPLLLPLGIVLRSIPACRGIGAAFIALALGFYIAFSSSILFNEKIVETAYGGDPNWWKSLERPAAIGALPTVPLAGYAAINKLGGLKVLERAKEWIKDKFDVLGKRFSWLGVLTFTLTLTSIIFSFMAEYVPFIVVVLGAFLPLLTIIISFAVTRELAALLGTDINLGTMLKVL